MPIPSPLSSLTTAACSKSIREIDFEQAFALRENGSVSYFGEKWDGNLDRGDQGEPN